MGPNRKGHTGELGLVDSNPQQQDTFVVQFAPPQVVNTATEGEAQFTAEPSDAITTFVFMANLYAQEASGDAAASTSAQRVLHRLRGSSESRTYIFGIAFGNAPLGQVSQLGLPLIASTGDCPQLDYSGFIHIHVPLLEETSTADVEFVFDVNFLPMPGEVLGDEEEELAQLVVDTGVRLAQQLGRTVIQTGTLHSADTECDADPFTRAISRRGFCMLHAERQLSVEVPEVPPSVILPHGVSIKVWADYDIEEDYLDGVIELLTIASEDTQTGDLTVEPIQWTRQRLAQAHGRLRSRGSHIVMCALVSDGEILSLTELGRHANSDPEVAEWNVTVTARQHRRQGLALLAKLAALRVVRAHWPDVTRTYSSVGVSDPAMQGIYARLGAKLLSGSEMWELKLGDAPRQSAKYRGVGVRLASCGRQ
ncbi:MAG: GNAT family acetyltransferase [Corynebacterium sp.]|nr:GNAT family acetyltransferase [Corynebacterium sp.]